MPFRVEDNISEYLDRKAEEIRQKIIQVLMYVGEEAVREARERGRYKDQTGNLRSSIGYSVVEDGKVIAGSSFDVVKTGQKGAHEGRSFLQRLVSEHSSGLVLIIVAGMDYAVYVEAKNLNVLDSAEQLTERLLPQMIKGLKL